MSLWDRFEGVIKSEWNSRFQDPFEAFRKGSEPSSEEGASDISSNESFGQRAKKTAKMQPSAHRKIKSAAAAFRLLNLHEDATLEEIRGAYQQMAQRYHPETFNPNPDKARAAQTLIETLSEAFEVLEAQKLPLSKEA